MRELTKRTIALGLVAAMSAALFAGCGSSESSSADANAKSEGVMTYAEYEAADVDSEVTIEAYVQAATSWWDNKITIYAQDPDGAYFIYDMACSEEDAAKLTKGTKLKATGYKSEWSGEVEIVDASFEIEDGSYVAEATDVTSLLGTDELASKMNQFVAFTDMEVVASVDADGNEAASLYNWDGSGAQGDDVYFNVSKDGQTYTFLVRKYITDSSTDVYKAAEALNIGDKLDMEGFLYWYEGPNPHITSITVK